MAGSAAFGSDEALRAAGGRRFLSPVMKPITPLLALAAALPSFGQNSSDWFPWEASNPRDGGVFHMDEWLEKPAGKHGRIRAEGDELLYNGKPIRLWGTNLCYRAGTCPEKAVADGRAALYRKYGVNSIRLHKFADGSGFAGMQSKDSFAEFDPELLDLFDYQFAKLKEAGIYLKFSATFGPPKLGPKDAEVVPYLNEFGAFDKKRNRVSVPHSGIYFAPEVQTVQIAQMTNLLKHRNPYTGLTYAEDPALWDVEIVNEQSVLFYTSPSAMQASATVRKRVGERFTNWLLEKYGSAEKLLEAWGGEKSIEANGLKGVDHVQSIAKKSILPVGTPWNWDPANVDANGLRERNLDTMEFLVLLQDEYYQRFVAEVRETGYDGEISASNWQAGSGYSHYANLWSDAQIGTVDRHNYFGGGKGFDVGENGGKGKVSLASMFDSPGSGILTSGMQQVADRPFMLSEWIHTFPNPWLTEGAAIIAAYGMGLQGWDVSYMFQNGNPPEFIDRRRHGWNSWATPNVLGMFPVLSRQVLRGDVAEAEEVAVLKVHPPSLNEGKLGFGSQVEQGYDDKSFNTDVVPQQTLAVTRVAIEFTKEPEETQPYPWKKAQADGFLKSTTGELAWKTGEGKRDEFFVMDTPGTQAVVGFSGGEEIETAAAKWRIETPFAAVYLTAMEKDGSLPTSGRVLLAAMARVDNTGMSWESDRTVLQDHGKAPMRLEPVKARIEFKERVPQRVVALDHSGVPTDVEVPVKDGVLELDTGREKTPYFLLEF